MIKLRHLAAAAMAAGGILLVAPAAAQGTPPLAGCAPVLHTTLDGVTTTAGGKATVQADGLLMETTAVEDAVLWRRDLPAAVPLGSVNKLSYMTRKLDNGAGNPAALPAFRLFLKDMDGPNDTTTLVFEPYYQITGNPALNVTVTWDVTAGKWWSTKAVAGITHVPAGSYASNFDLATLKAANPSAKVVAFGVGQGTYNAGTKGRVNNVIFKTGPVCVQHTWTLPAASPSSSAPSASATPSATASASATATASPSSTPPSTPPSASASPTPTATAGPDSGGSGKLPLTGVALPVVGGTGLALVAVGLGLFLYTRRNRNEFVAE